MSAGGWQDIASAPHDEVVLLAWQSWDGIWTVEATTASHGERFPNGYSTMSYHGQATHWQPIPPMPTGPNLALAEPSPLPPQ